MAETGHVLTSWLCDDQVETDGLDFKTTMQASFSVWTSKPGADQYGRMAEMEGMWCHYEACIEAKKSHEGGVSIRCFYKKMDHFCPYMGIYRSY